MCLVGISPFSGKLLLFFSTLQRSLLSFRQYNFQGGISNVFYCCKSGSLFIMSILEKKIRALLMWRNESVITGCPTVTFPTKFNLNLRIETKKISSSTKWRVISKDIFMWGPISTAFQTLKSSYELQMSWVPFFVFFAVRHSVWKSAKNGSFEFWKFDNILSTIFASKHKCSPSIINLINQINTRETEKFEKSKNQKKSKKSQQSQKLEKSLSSKNRNIRKITKIKIKSKNP